MRAFQVLYSKHDSFGAARLNTNFLQDLSRLHNFLVPCNRRIVLCCNLQKISLAKCSVRRRRNEAAHNKLSEVLHGCAQLPCQVLHHFTRFFEHLSLHNETFGQHKVLRLIDLTPCRLAGGVLTAFLISHSSAPSAMNLSSFIFCCSSSSTYDLCSLKSLVDEAYVYVDTTC